ncbi:MAG: hypothetical protein LUC94_11645 [Clostridiales bacterium]|nr:hypothetical protein [Clostridiales bacterium]
MMKKLIIVVPSQLQKDGTISIKNIKSLRLTVAFLRESYEITLLVQTYREKTISDISNLNIRLIYDNSLQNHIVDVSAYSSRFQVSFQRWSKREGLSVPVGCRLNIAAVEEYDCLIAWDGCLPWCLATALSHVTAKRRLLWIQDNPQLYLMTEDHPFYADICASFDSVIALDEEIKAKVDSIFGAMEREHKRCAVVRLPVDISWYWEQSEQSVSCDFQADEMNVLAISRMSVESVLEQLPGWFAGHQDHFPPLHCWLAGNGERLDRYIQQIAIYSVDSMFTLVGQVDNLYPYIRHSDVLVVCGDERRRDLKIAAEIFGVPVIRFEELEQCLPGLSQKRKQDMPTVSAWQDREKMIKLLESGKCDGNRFS